MPDSIVLKQADTPHAYLRRKVARLYAHNPEYNVAEMADGEDALYIAVRRPDGLVTCEVYLFRMEGGRMVHAMYPESSFPYCNGCPLHILQMLSPIYELFETEIERDRAIQWRDMQLAATPS